MIKTLIQILACNLVGMPPRRTALAAAGGFERIRRIRAHHDEPAQCRQERIGIAQIQRRPAHNFATDAHWPRAEERRVGKECVGTCRYGWSTSKKTKKKIQRTRRKETMIK